MHMFDVERHFLGGNGIVGGQIPMAAGAAFKSMYTGDGGVTLCFFGDGAIHQGAFHETLNLAKIWNLPIVFIVENNQFGMGTAVKRISGVEDFSVKAQGYNLQGRVVNGMDVLDVYDAIKEVTDDSRKNGNAWLLDIKTYRYKGHSMSDPAKYRTKDELESYKQQDPIVQLKEQMIEAKMLTEAEYKKLDTAAKELVQASVEFAENSEEPALHTMYEDILA